MRKQELKALRICFAQMRAEIVRLHLVVRRSAVKIFGDVQSGERKILTEQYRLIAQIAHSLRYQSLLQFVEKITVATAVAVQPRLVIALPVEDRRQLYQALGER